MKKRGLSDGAFVGAFVLDARFGLGRGFDVYDDRMLGRGGDVEFVQRSAEQVLAPAYDWITASAPTPGGSGSASSRSRRAPRSRHPAPSAHPRVPGSRGSTSTIRTSRTQPPEPYRTRYASEPYDGEIAYADAALGAFARHFAARRARPHTGRHRL